MIVTLNKIAFSNKQPSLLIPFAYQMDKNDLLRALKKVQLWQLQLLIIISTLPLETLYFISIVTQKYHNYSPNVLCQKAIRKALLPIFAFYTIVFFCTSGCVMVKFLEVGNQR